MHQVMVIAVPRQGQLTDETWECLACAQELQRTAGLSCAALVLGSGLEGPCRELAAYCPQVFSLEDASLAHFNSEAYARALVPALRKLGPALLLMPHNLMGMDLAPLLAVSLDAPLLTDCQALAVEGQEVAAKRQCFANKVEAWWACDATDSAVATLRLGAFDIQGLYKTEGAVSPLPLEGETTGLGKEFLGYVEAEKGEVDLAGEEIIVAVGRGLPDQESLPLVEQVASAMGGVLACSRPLVDQKWLSSPHQVGISGATVKPRLYLALGISGSFQHTAGIQGSPLVVAVNQDAEAPIFRLAKYGVVAELAEFLPKLLESLQAARA